MLNIDQIKIDLAYTQRDENRLRVIVDSLSEFINYSHGENRQAFRVDLMKYMVLLGQASELKAKIQRALSEIEANQQKQNTCTE